MPVSERSAPMDEATMKCGLLMESAQAHQKLAEEHLDRLRVHTLGLDEVVRDAIRRTLIDELRELTAECEGAKQALRGVKRAANLRGLFWSLTAAVLSSAVPLVAVRWVLPSAERIDALRAERDQLTASVARLEQQGGRIEWRRCGDSARLCVHVDRSAPSYGDKSDYFVVKGY
jgi:hypothetical protein